MTQPALPSVLFVGNDPSLEYLLTRYADRSGCQLQSVRENSNDVDVHTLQPRSVWFASLETLEASQTLTAAATNADVPVVVCASVADETRALELGADYFFLHPITYDHFVSTLAEARAPQPKQE